MNDVNGVIGIEDEDDLKRLVAATPTPHEELAVASDEWPGRLRVADDAFGLVRVDAVLGNVLSIPIIPAELHRSTENEPATGRLLFQ